MGQKNERAIIPLLSKNARHERGLHVMCVNGGGGDRACDIAGDAVG